MSRQREQAARVHERVRGYKGNGEAKLRTLCMKTPALIHQSGLAQALVFLRSRDGEHGERFVADLAHGLGRSDVKTGDALIKKALQTPMTEYMVLTASVADVAAWFRRFAQIELSADGEE
jgi:CRISPR/Cas system CMR-associated protein Cmr5 small subunit